MSERLKALLAGSPLLPSRACTKGDHGLRVAVLVNDFGSINVDADLMVGVESGGDVISLANGCVCCNHPRRFARGGL